MKSFKNSKKNIFIPLLFTIFVTVNSNAQTTQVNLPGAPNYLFHKPFGVWRNSGNSDLGFNERGILFAAYQDNAAKLKFRYSNYQPMSIQYYPWSNALLFQIVNGNQSSAVGAEITSWKTAMSIQNISGKVQIGEVSTPGNYRLYVKDGILTEQIKVALHGTSAWADYVFEDGYDLKSLKEVDKFIQSEKHLPNMLSAAEIAADGGFELKAMAIKQQEKIEELFLHLIEMDKRMQVLEEENNMLKQQIQKTNPVYKK